MQYEFNWSFTDFYRCSVSNNQFNFSKKFFILHKIFPHFKYSGNEKSITEIQSQKLIVNYRTDNKYDIKFKCTDKL